MSTFRATPISQERNEFLEYLDGLQPEEYKSLIEGTKHAKAKRKHDLAKTKVELNRLVKTLANVRHGVRFGIKKGLVLEVNGEMYPDENGEVELAKLEVTLTEEPARGPGDPAFEKILENLENHLLENIESSIGDLSDLPSIPEINVLRQEMADAVEALQNEADDLEGHMVDLGQETPAETEPHHPPKPNSYIQDSHDEVVSRLSRGRSGRESLWEYIVREAFKMEQQSEDPIGWVVAKWPMGETTCEGFTVDYTSPAARAIKPESTG